MTEDDEKNYEEETKDEQRKKMDEGEMDEDVSTEEGREKLVEDGEISPTEAGFSEGAEGRGGMTSDARTGELLGDKKDEVFEKKEEGKKKLFASKENAEKGQRD